MPRRYNHAALGGVVQLVRTPACHAGGRGFESRRSRPLYKPFPLCVSRALPCPVIAEMTARRIASPSARGSVASLGRGMTSLHVSSFRQLSATRTPPTPVLLRFRRTPGMTFASPETHQLTALLSTSTTAEEKFSWRQRNAGEPLPCSACGETCLTVRPGCASNPAVLCGNLWPREDQLSSGGKAPGSRIDADLKWKR